METIILSSNLDQPKTGGEIINAHVYGYFQGKVRNTRIIQLKDLPAFCRKSLVFSMFWFLFKLGGAKETTIIESQALAGPLLLFNFWHRLSGKRTKIVSYAFHLSKHDKARLSRFIALAEKVMFQASDKIICLSESTKHDIVLEGVPAEKVCVVPPGTDLTGKTNKRFTEGGCVRLLFAGNVVPRKGVIHLVEALSQVNGDFLLDVVGCTDKDQEYFARVKKLIEEKGLERKVVFHGWKSRSEMEKLYANADLFVFPSLWEGFGMALLEAMAFGLPVVSTKASAIPELIVNGENGFLVPQKNTAAMAGAITRLIASPQLRREISENNRRKAYADYSWQKIGERFYREVTVGCPS